MPYKIAGFNAFGQYSLQNTVCDEFRDIVGTDNLENTCFKLLLQRWSYCVFLKGKSLCAVGAWFGKTNQTIELNCPCNISNITEKHITGNDSNIYLLDKDTETIWRWSFSHKDEQEWTKITPFLNVESNEYANMIIKIVSSEIINLCLTNNGEVYQIPQKIHTEHCEGKVVDVDCGHGHAILLTDTGNVYTWGIGSRCQLGHGNLEDAEEPSLVKGLAGLKMKKVKAGGWHCCALSDSGDVYVWGWNDKGQLGVSNNMNNSDNEANPADDPKSLDSSAEPLLVELIDNSKCIEYNAIDISCGSKHTAILLDDNSLWVSGCNDHSQLGFQKDLYDYIGVFKKVYDCKEGSRILCAHWSTVIEIGEV